MVQRTHARAAAQQGHMAEAPPGSICGGARGRPGSKNRALFWVPIVIVSFSPVDGRED